MPAAGSAWVPADCGGFRVGDEWRRGAKTAALTPWSAVKTWRRAQFLRKNGNIDRDKLGELVFGNVEKRRLLNRIMWLPLASGLGHKLLYHFAVGTPVVILDAPLLFETGLQHLCSAVVVVSMGTRIGLPV
eukprot:scaffold1021_cov241-Pinguiococcus_pyrenoidosus.AAC.6